MHRYPRAASLADLLRGLLGLLVCALLVFIVQPERWLVLVLVVFAALFALYVCRVLLRCRTRIEMDTHALRVFASPKSGAARICLDWDKLDRLDLDYFCTRRDGRGGWLQLRLRSGPWTVRLDSRLQGFEHVLARAAAAARICGVALSATTASNLVAIGIDDGID